MKEEPLQRFIDAQKHDYAVALEEVSRGRKRSHWMWYIFPQLKGLGHSSTSQFYGINGLPEAKAYLEHPVLGARLKEISAALLELKSNNALEIFGSPDHLKLKSSMTLFSAVPQADPVFERVLEKFFEGKKDHRTLSILEHQRE